MSDFHARVQELVDQVHLNFMDVDGFKFVVEPDVDGGVYLQVRCWRPDTYSGDMGWGQGGKAYLTEDLIDGEIVRRAFGLFMAYVEHEAREAFTYCGRRVFGPHIAIEALWAAAENEEHRQ
jgi:hypothetical protein